MNHHLHLNRVMSRTFKTGVVEVKRILEMFVRQNQKGQSGDIECSSNYY
jgi:hypothetical protein